MFNLDQAIAGWRRQLADAGIKSPDALDELECHLRDDIEQQARSGTDLQTAFESAVLRVGQAWALREEFARSGPVRGRLGWRLVRGACFTTAAFVFLIETWTLLEFDLGRFERLIGLCVVALVTAYLACLPYLGLWFSRSAYARFIAGLKIACGFVPFVPIYCLLSDCHVIRLELGFMPNFLLWLALTAVALTGFVCGWGGAGWRDGGFGGPIPPSWPGMRVVSPGGPYAPEKFSPTFRQSLTAAHEEASRLGHDFIGTEHLLLAALKLAPGAAATLLRESRIECETVRLEIERLVIAGPGQNSEKPLPLTPRAQRALRLALKEARTQRHSLVRVEHIVLGLLREGSGVAALALKNLGVSVERLREEISNLSLQSRPRCEDSR